MTNTISIDEPSKGITFGTNEDDLFNAFCNIWFNIDGGEDIYGDYLWLNNPLNNTLTFDIGAQTIKSGKQTIGKVKNIEKIYVFNQGSDIIIDKDNTNLIVIATGEGDDIYYAGAGNKIYEGSTGYDSILFDKASKALNINLTDSPLNDTMQMIYLGDFVYSISHVEKIGGSKKNDTITIATNGYVVDGFKGNDTITGGVNHDSIGGGAGKDILTGGEGNDVFIFAESGSANVDTISDFQRGSDKILLNTNIFSSLSFITDGNIVNGSKPLDVNDYLIIKADSKGILTVFYDADGSGTRSTAQAIVKLLGINQLNSEDFVNPPL